ncbi:hypothetical protein GY45DRAFT_306219 [Cubamyces sp. BRFM 1775]|nr:hypothetical protein GY45DRAFT_306219 [Cubamyces sp. BRFM 1775]
MRSWGNPTESERIVGPQEQLAADDEQRIADMLAGRRIPMLLDADYDGGMVLSFESIVHS